MNKEGYTDQDGELALGTAAAHGLTLHPDCYGSQTRVQTLYPEFQRKLADKVWVASLAG